MIRIGLRTAAWTAAIVCGVAASVHAQAVHDLPRPRDCVSDFAHVLSPATEMQLDRLCGEVDREAHAQIAVVTVNTLNGEPIQQYAAELEDSWKVGDRHSDRGVIVLVAVRDRRRFIATGYGLRSILPDGRVGDIGRAMRPMLRNNDFDGAMTLAVDEISQIIAQNAGVKLQPLTRWGAAERNRQPHATLGQIIGGIIFLVFVLIFLLWAGGSGLFGFLMEKFFGGAGRWRGGGLGGGGDFGGRGGGSGSGFGGFGSGNTGGGGAGGDW